MIERSVVDDERGIVEKAEEVVSDLGKCRLVAQEFGREAMDRERLGRHGALGIDVAVKGVAGREAVVELDATDLDQAIALIRIEPGGLGVEHDLAHQIPAVLVFRHARHKAGHDGG